MELEYVSQEVSDQEILAHYANADFIFTDVIKEISSTLIQNMPNLKLIQSEGVGFNKIDIQAAKERKIYVCNNKGVNASAVAEQTVLLMLGLLRKVVFADSQVRKGSQINAKGTMILDGIRELGDCTVGLIGIGAIGKAVAELLKAFGCTVFYYSHYRLPEQKEKSLNVIYKSLEELTKQSDIISLHVPVTSETEKMVNADFLAAMKNTCFLINTARGEIVDQNALQKALTAGSIAGAGLDTLSPEPVTSDNPLLNLPETVHWKVLFSPHIGGTTLGAFRRMHQGSWKNIERVMRNERPVNIVNGV